MKLLAFLHCGGATLVEIGREVIQMHALRTFLRSLHANKGKGDVAGRHLANKPVGCQPEEALPTSSAGMIGRSKYIAIKRKAVSTISHSL